MTPAEIVHQRSPKDCGVAALAMFLEVSYEDVEAAGKKAAAFDWSPRIAMTPHLMWAIAERFGKPMVSSRYGVDGRAAVIWVANEVGDTLHAVYWDGERVWDPDPAAPYSKAYVRDHRVMVHMALEDFGPVLSRKFPTVDTTI